MKKLKNIFLGLIVMLLVTSYVNVSAREDFDNNLFQTDEQLNVTGNYEGTSFFAGETVTINSVINGISFVAGNTINVGGYSDYSFMAGYKIEINNVIGKDLFLAGNNITLDQGSSISRDVYIASSTVNLESIIGRNAYIYGEEVNFINTTISGNLNILSDKIIFGENVQILGTLKYNSDAEVIGLDRSSIGTIFTYHHDDIEEDEEDIILNNIKNFFTSLIGLLVIGIVLYAIFPNMFKKFDNQVESYNVSKGMTDFGLGLLILISLPFVALFLFLTIIGIPISLLGIVIYAVCIYLSTLFMGYLIGNLIVEKLFHRNSNGYIAIVIGVTLIKLVALAPVVGWLSGLIILCLGLSLCAKALFKKEKEIEIVKESISVKTPSLKVQKKATRKPRTKKIEK